MRQLLIFFSFLIFLLFFLVWTFGPREPAEIATDKKNFDIGLSVDSYLWSREIIFDDLIKGAEKKVLWANKTDFKTPISIIYIHGFTASSMELRPVPEIIASNLGANIFFTRLTGHGRTSLAMEEASVSRWLNDVDEALEIGRRLGEKVIILANSTGGTLAAAAAVSNARMENVVGIVFISPNFGVNNIAAKMLSWPFARYWVPWIIGDFQISKPRNPNHEKFWTTTYPTVSLMPMAALVKSVMEANYRAVKIPALFYFSLDDKVVQPQKTLLFASNWGGDVSIINPILGSRDDKLSHIVAGEIVSPGQTEFAVETILIWIKSLSMESGFNEFF